MTYEVLARKWRPQTFQDVIGQEHITRTLINAMKTGRLAHAYLFAGARGVGKTSVARILAKAMNCVDGEEGSPCNRCRSCLEITGGSSVDVQEIDGASNRGIEEIRELREGIKYMPSASRFRVYIIDEVHMLTLPAFNALLKTLEEPPPHVKFIFATTEPHKVPVTILSRCQRFDFKRIALARIVDQLGQIAEAEGIRIEKSGLALIAREAEGSMRDAESLLDQVVSFTGSEVGEKDIADILGIVDRALLFETSLALIQGSPQKCIEIVDRIYNFGYDIKEFYRALMDQFRNLLVCVLAPQASLLDMIDWDREETRRQAEMAGVEKLQQALNLLIAREENLRFTSHPRLVLETIMIRLCLLGDLLSFEELLEKIHALEGRLVTSGCDESPPSHPIVCDPPGTWNAEAIPENDRQSGWEDFLSYLSKKNRAMANVLKEWRFLGLEGNTLRIARGATAFSSRYLDEPERLERFTAYGRDFFKAGIRVQVVDNAGRDNKKEGLPGEEGKAAADQRHSDLPRAVQNVLEVFQGEIKGTVSSQGPVKEHDGEAETPRREW